MRAGSIDLLKEVTGMQYQLGAAVRQDSIWYDLGVPAFQLPVTFHKTAQSRLRQRLAILQGCRHVAFVQAARLTLENPSTGVLHLLTPLRLGLYLLLSAPALASAQAPAPLSALGFMSGCWQGTAGRGRTIQELYTTPTHNVMQGVTRYLRNDSVIDYEFTLIQATARGPRITPHPKGQAATSFEVKETAPGRVVWENLGHDFPQRIIYRSLGNDSLVARIEGKTERGDQAMEWRMGRMACPGR